MSYKDKKINMIDLFSGAGGLTLGFVKQNFYPVFTVENWQDALKTYNFNFNTNVSPKDITDLNVINEMKSINLNSELVIGGFPCQGFSMAGKRSKDDPRNKLYEYTVDVIVKTQPKVFVLENVKGILSYKENDGIYVVDKIRNLLTNNNYYVNYVLLDASKFGVPQKRERVIFIGSSNENKHLVDIVINNLKSTNLKIKTVREAIYDLEDKANNEVPNHIITNHSLEMKKRLWEIPEGKSLYADYSDAFRKLYYDKPSYTVKENHGGVHVHPIKGRVLTPRELARLQSFPDDFIFLGTKSSTLKQIGNAVPVALAEVIARNIRKVFFSSKNEK